MKKKQNLQNKTISEENLVNVDYYKNCLNNNYKNCLNNKKN